MEYKLKKEKEKEKNNIKSKIISDNNGKLILNYYDINDPDLDIFNKLNLESIDNNNKNILNYSFEFRSKNHLNKMFDNNEIEEKIRNKTIDNEKLLIRPKTGFKSAKEINILKHEKTENLEETKFTLSYISEKNGNNYELALEQWEKFGKSTDKKYSLIGRDRTKKIFYKFKENKNTGRDEKERLFRKYIQWLLEKYQEEAFEVVIKTDIVSPKIFMEEIIPEFNRNKSDGKEGEDLKEKYLEY